MPNLIAPQLLSDLPNYPLVDQLCQVTAPTIGNNIYPAVTQQYTGSLTFRGRELCYVQEPNGVRLGPQIYDCRLVGSHLGLPLYATTCCLSGTFPSSSVIGSSTTSATPAQRTLVQEILGTGNQSVSVTVATGLLVVNLAALVSGSLGNITVKLNGVSLTADSDSGSFASGFGVTGEVAVYSIAVAAGAYTLTVTSDGLNPASTFYLGDCINVTGLASNVLDAASHATGAASAPSVASVTPSVALTYASGACIMLVPGGTFTWLNSFTEGDEFLGNFGGLDYAFTEAYRLLTAQSAVQAALSVTPLVWGLAQAVYK